jgi:hypothetical protein
LTRRAAPPPCGFVLDEEEYARMWKAGEEGKLEEVLAWYTAVYERLDAECPDPRSRPPGVTSRLDELADMTTALEMAHRGAVGELRDFMAMWVMELDGARPDQQAAIRRRIDSVVSVLHEQGVAPAGDLTALPGWARDEPGAASSDTDRLIVRYRLRRLLGRYPPQQSFEVAPAMLVMRGPAGKVRIPRHRDLEGGHARKVVRWVAGHGWPVERVTGRKVFDHVDALGRRQVV